MTIYLIAATPCVRSLMVSATGAFNFYPVTAVMIVMIAVLNDAAILSGLPMTMFFTKIRQKPG